MVCPAESLDEVGPKFSSLSDEGLGSEDVGKGG